MHDCRTVDCCVRMSVTCDGKRRYVTQFDGFFEENNTRLFTFLTVIEENTDADHTKY